MEFTYALRFGFEASNNEAEYKALIDGLRIAEQIGIKNLQAHVDSRLVANQGENKKADALSKITSTSFAHLSKQVLVEELKEKSIDEKEVLAVVEEEGRTWITPIHEYLVEKIHLEEKKKARAVCRKARSIHAGHRSMVEKALRSGYYWPTMHADARKLIRECNDSEPFPEGPGKVNFLIVAIDYFTKWIEAKPVATITGAQIEKFVWDNIVCRFGFLGEIISDNKNQFRDNPFKDWCEKLCIHQCFASVKYPPANGLVESENRSLGKGIKARLEEISHVLQAHRTMIKSSNVEKPFSLTYGTEAVIPVEIGMPTLRTLEVNMIKNNEALGINLGKKKESSHAKEGGKRGPKWEGPYEVMKALGKGPYKLRDRNGNVLPQTWNVCNLKKCYVHEM
ncbi:reverse transcriptase domain-containing protein [Tanacetum coccineum]